METSVKSTTIVGLGHSNQADAFQKGREAAQIAKSQIPDDSPDLVLGLAPGDENFQDFIEGVRLVTGEAALVGIPVDRVASSDLALPKACQVLIIQSGNTHFSIGATKDSVGNTLATVSAIVSQFRQQHGNTLDQYEHRGVLFCNDSSQSDIRVIGQTLMADVGLDSWLAGFTARSSAKNPILCRDKVVSNGVLGIECLSQNPWGLGTVNVGSFLTQPNIYDQAVKSVLRDAHQHLKGNPPAFGLLLFPFREKGPAFLKQIFQTCQSVIRDTPLLAISTQHQPVRYFNRSVLNQANSITAVLVPK